MREALERVRTRIRRAAERSGRDPGSVRLVAVSKTVPAQRVRQLADCGQILFGENRVQEALTKIADVGPGVSWHMIGHLQRNKAKLAVGVFELIHGVDNLALAEALERRAAADDMRQAILLQVNLSGESSKSGASEAELPGLLEAVAGLTHLDLRGLMTIPAPGDPEDARGWFRRLRELRDEAATRLGRPLPELSMGMSDDFEVAVEEGATLVRVGRALFGERLT